MKRLFSGWLINVICLWVLDLLFDSIAFPSTGPLLLAALVLGILNATLKPLLKLLSLPATTLTLGLFSIVIDGLILHIALRLGGAASVPGFWTTLLAAVFLSILNGAVSRLIKDE